MGSLLHRKRKTNLNLVTRPGSIEDAMWIAPRLRPEDKREVEHVSGRAEEVLPLAVSISRECYTFRIGPHEPPFAIFGVTDDPNSDKGVVWFLATHNPAPLAVLEEAKHWLAHWRRFYYVLHAVVDSRNEVHVRWLEL
jgi:hypothetical protein